MEGVVVVGEVARTASEHPPMNPQGKSRQEKKRCSIIHETQSHPRVKDPVDSVSLPGVSRSSGPPQQQLLMPEQHIVP